jgi:uncharacterized protein (TIGR02001 family)
MRNLRITLFLLSAMLLFIETNITAQDALAKDSTSPFSVGADVVSTYVWRGSAFSGPSIQPSVKYTKGGFSVGIWGSVDFAGTYAEADPFISYTAPFGLTVGVSDYYYPGLDLFEVSDTAGSHGLELNLGYTIKGFSLSANYIVNEAPGAGTVGGDTYIQAGYVFKNFNVFLGAGNGWYTSDTDFAICNIGLSATKEIKVTDTFSIPVFGQIVVNPEKKNLFLVVGFTF